jgi:hypothetical protein
MTPFMYIRRFRARRSAAKRQWAAFIAATEAHQAKLEKASGALLKSMRDMRDRQSRRRQRQRNRDKQ